MPGRYGFHDLLRAYAADLGRALDSATDREETRGRLYDHYLHTAHAPDLLIGPHRLARPVELAQPRPGTRAEEPSDHVQTLSWLAAEHQVLLGLVRQAADTGHHGHAWRLAGALVTFLDRRGHWGDLAETHRIGLDSATRDADRLGQAHERRGLAIGRFGHACTGLG